MDIVDNLFLGDKRAIARSISIIDDEDPQSHDILKKIYKRTGNAITIGFTVFHNTQYFEVISQS